MRGAMECLHDGQVVDVWRINPRSPALVVFVAALSALVRIRLFRDFEIESGLKEERLITVGVGLLGRKAARIGWGEPGR